MLEKLLDDLQSSFSTGVGAVIKAVLLLVLAVVVATVVQTLVQKLLAGKKVSGFLAKVDGNEPGSTAGFIGKLAYLIVFLLFVPGIMGALKADSVAQPVLGLLNKIWNFVPNVLAAVIVLLVGSSIARLVRQLLVPVFQKLKVDRLQEKAGLTVPDSAKLSNTLSYVVYVLILIPVIITALQVLDIRVISDPAVSMLNVVFNKIPSIIAAAFMGLNQLGIASVIVNSAFILILAALAVAFAVAFGIGGRDFAAKTLEKLSDKLETSAKPEDGKKADEKE